MGIFRMKLVKGDNNSSDFGLIGRGIEVSGDINFAEQLHVHGRVSGKLSSDSGTLVIGESGEIEAHVEVGVCVIHGKVQGNLIAKSKVEIRRSGRVNGDVVTPVLLVEEGAVFDGLIKMTQEPAAPRLKDVSAEDSEDDERRQARRAY
jgi:cytoskeletal protein CcmA (bactofilin family)